MCLCLQSRLMLEETVSASLGQLWLELLRFYTLEFALEEHIISIRLRELLPRELKHWPRRRLAIEGEQRDPVWLRFIYSIRKRIIATDMPVADELLSIFSAS